MSLILGKNSSNELQPCQMDGSNNIKVDIAGSSGGAIAADVNIIADSVGLATSALQTSGNASLTTIAGDTTSMDAKITACNTGAVVVSSSALPTGAATEATLLSIDSYQSGISLDASELNQKTTQGYDAQVASGGSGLQQNLIYGRDNSGNLDALKTDASGHLEVVVDDFVKGQATMANSFPVVLSSDQSAISVSSAGGNTTNVNDVLAPGAGGTATSTAVDMDGFTNVSFFGSTTNSADPIFVQVSHNNSTWVENTEAYINLSPSGEFFVNFPNTGARYYRVQQIDSLATAFTLTVNSSKK
tara:strand:- start:21 stop:926 length:906 start_codon:yes stop_codon:yes gene_type:complete